MAKIIRIDNKEDLKHAFDVREEVFVVEQKVSREEEFDEFEEESRHYLVMDNDIPCGASRWRTTDYGVKLERIAIKESHRGKGLASQLMQAMIDDIHNDNQVPSDRLYLNAQVNAMPLYSKFGFLAEGSTFMECDILHQKMVREIL